VFAKWLLKKEVGNGLPTATASCRSTVAEQSERVGFLFYKDTKAITETSHFANTVYNEEI